MSKTDNLSSAQERLLRELLDAYGIIDFSRLKSEPMMGVNATPDAEYPIRLLRAYRDNNLVCWKVDGLSEDVTTVYDAMNAAAEDRVRILEAALAILRTNDARALLERTAGPKSFGDATTTS